jgi:hypothetical protein
LNQIIPYFLLIGLPSIGLLLNFIIKPKSKIDALLVAIALIGYNYYIYLTGDWINLASVLLSILPLVLYNLIIIIHLIFRLIKIKKWWHFNWSILFKVAISIWIFIPVVKYQLIEYPAGVLLDYPLKNGSYYVIQGGILSSMNQHHVAMKNLSNNEVKYAVDIVKLNVYGNQRNKSIQNEVEQHEIYMDTLYSPSNGIVLETKDDEKDYVFERPLLLKKNKGNYIVTKFGKILIVNGHLKMNSIMVKEGDSVQVGQPIALIGHSGQSNVPHLHIHAYTLAQTRLDKGDSTEYLYPIPLYFGNSIFPEKNNFIDP